MAPYLWRRLQRCWRKDQAYEALGMDLEGGEAQKKKKKVGTMVILKRLFQMIWTGGNMIRFLTGVSFFLLIATKVTTVLIPQTYKIAIDQLTKGKFPLAAVIGYAAMRILSSLCDGGRESLFVKVQQYAVRLSARRTFEHLHQLSIRFHIGRQTGTVLRSVERGTEAVSYVLSFLLFNIAPTLFELLLTSIILFSSYSPWYAIIIIIIIAVYVAWTLGITEWRTKLRRETIDANNLTTNRAVDSLLNFETVKYFSNEEHESERYNQALLAYQTASVKSQLTLSMLNAGQSVIISVGLAAVMTLAAWQATKGKVTIGDFVLINTYLLQLYAPLNWLGTSYRMIKTSLVDLENMYELLEEKPEVQDAIDAEDFVVSEGRVVFKNVFFGYDPTNPVLNDISFEIAPGTTTAIVGASGQGKSTIARLLFRFYDPTTGSIAIDGQELSQVTQRSLRRQIGVVPQDCVLFNDTIEYNIRYGRPTATLDQVYEAARLAKIHDFIMGLPDGYETKVGERGLRLSGGEKQRVGIARAILKNPSIMIYDEATSALDTKVEREIQASLRQISVGKTTLTIAHRLSTIQHAQQIIVLVGGRIAERGSHSDLLAKKGEYYSLWNVQQEEQAEKERQEAELESLNNSAELPLLPAPDAPSSSGHHHSLI
jgi:ATP-binding cassette subfamily B protein